MQSTDNAPGVASPDGGIYLDHAATSWPKPPGVRDCMVEFLDSQAANAGRSGHGPSIRAARMVFDTRERLADLLGVPDSSDLVFTRGATEGINLVLKGFLQQGDRVAVSPLEHNAVMRPLNRLAAERNVRVDTLPADPLGRIHLAKIREKDDRAPPRLVVVAHASNVNGLVQDLTGLRQAFPRSAILVDAAQTVGVLPIDVVRDGIDFLACSAHKGLLGPTGVGVCYLNPEYEVRPLIEGGTGSRSEDTAQPAHRPDRYEAGTLNLHGIAGLCGALDHIATAGLLGDLKRRMTSRLIESLHDAEGVRLYTPQDGIALMLSLTLDGMVPDEAATRLERDYGVLCRPGLQCAPLAHRHLGTFPPGTIRLSPGFGNTEEDINRAAEAVRHIAAQSREGSRG